MNKKEQLALLIDLEDFFWRRTTEFIKVNLKELGERSNEEVSPATLFKRVEERILNHKTMELVHNRMIERREAILLEVVEKFPSDLVDVYMSGYDIVTKILGTDVGDW